MGVDETDTNRAQSHVNAPLLTSSRHNATANKLEMHFVKHGDQESVIAQVPSIRSAYNKQKN